VNTVRELGDPLRRRGRRRAVAVATGNGGINEEELGGRHCGTSGGTKKQAGKDICAFAHLQLQRCNKIVQIQKKRQKTPSVQSGSRKFLQNGICLTKLQPYFSPKAT
jgi:hypothetical protein